MCVETSPKWTLLALFVLIAAFCSPKNKIVWKYKETLLYTGNCYNIKSGYYIDDLNNINSYIGL